jgi:hypothetical protein
LRSTGLDRDFLGFFWFSNSLDFLSFFLAFLFVRDFLDKEITGDLSCVLSTGGGGRLPGCPYSSFTQGFDSTVVLELQENMFRGFLFGWGMEMIAHHGRPRWAAGEALAPSAPGGATCFLSYWFDHGI